MTRVKLAVDFDGTCVDHDFPNVGKDAPHVEVVLKRLQSMGYVLILNTMRSGIYLDHALKWFSDRGIILYGVNRDPDQDKWTSSPKVYSEFYIDDAAVGAPLIKVAGFNRPVIDWLEVHSLIITSKSNNQVFAAEGGLNKNPSNTAKSLPL
jgi:hypothetical protein